jgi:transposase
MILLSYEGLSPPQIAQRVRLSDRTVRRTLDRYESEGMAGLRDQARPGRPARVTAAYLEQLEHTVERPPRALGLPFSNWTTANLAAYMAQQTGIEIKARQMENYLKAQGWRLRRPVRSIQHKQDQAQVTEKKSHV